MGQFISQIDIVCTMWYCSFTLKQNFKVVLHFDIDDSLLCLCFRVNIGVAMSIMRVNHDCGLERRWKNNSNLSNSIFFPNVSWIDLAYCL